MEIISSFIIFFMDGSSVRIRLTLNIIYMIFLCLRGLLDIVLFSIVTVN